MIFVQALWAALTSRLAGYIGTVAAIALAVMLGASTIKANAIEGELRQDKAVAEASAQIAETNLNTCHVSLSSANAALDAQTAAVRALQAESAARSSAASQAVQQARVATAALSKREAEIAAEKPGADLCKSADAILLESDQ